MEQENYNSQTVTSYKPVTKTYDLYEYDENLETLLSERELF